MRAKSNKLAKLERTRYSVFTEDLECCFFCGKSPVDIHEVYGGRNRRASMINGLCLPLCRLCHLNITVNSNKNLQLKRYCQIEYEKMFGHDKFMEITGKSYL